MARQDPACRPTALILATTIAVAQIVWTLVALLHLPLGILAPVRVVLYAIELGGPVLVARVSGIPTWHAHHISERYG